MKRTAGCRDYGERGVGRDIGETYNLLYLYDIGKTGAYRVS